jgi:hypothetical protein
MSFKVGDKVKVKTDDTWNGMEGSIFEIENGWFKVQFYDSNSIFREVELELVGDEKEVDSTTNADLHKQILDEMHDTYKRKNADYGNSFEEQYKEYGLLSVLIRLDDKMRRLKQLSKNEAQIKDESIRDTLMDLCNYSVMSVMELDKGSKE